MMRRNARLEGISHQRRGGFSPDVSVSKTERSIEAQTDVFTPQRRRGLSADRELHVFVPQEPHIVAGGPDEGLPMSPFLLHQAPAFHDENMPPRHKRRRYDLPEAAAPAEEDIQEISDAMEASPTPETWLTPVRAVRPLTAATGPSAGPAAKEDVSTLGVVRSGGPVGMMTCRMPSFVDWIDAEQDLPPLPAATPDGAGGPPSESGVDMTDLAMIYDPEMAAAAALRSPLSPVEKTLAGRPTVHDSD